MKINSFKCLTALAALALTFASCKNNEPEVPSEPEKTPEVELNLVSRDSENITFSLSTKDAESYSWYYTGDAEEGKTLPAGDFVFTIGNVSEASDELQTFTISELQPETSYWIYASAKSGDTYGVTDSLQVRTGAIEHALTAGEVSKTSLSYHVNVKDGETYCHAYLEGWYFNHMLATSMETEGSEFSMDTFLWNLLADFGNQATGPADYVWKNGDENTMRNQDVMLYGGQTYYALFSHIEGESGWTGTPEYVEMTLPEAGSTTGEVELTDEVIGTDRIRVRMVLDDSKVNYIFYDLYRKDQYDAKFAGQSDAAVKNFLYEYGLGTGNTYTDGWSVASGTDYVLAIMGVDNNGDSFLQTKTYTTPVPEPELDVQLRAYDRELEGYHGYNTARVDVTMKNFTDLNTDGILATLMPKYQWDAMLGMYGVSSLDDMMSSEMADYVYYLIQTPLQENESAGIKSSGRFTRIETDLESDTEYIFAIAFKYDGKWYYKTATATLDAEPSGEADAEYKAFLGEWTVTGKSTRDWSTAMTYNIKIEQLTANRTFKITGWSTSAAGTQFPFVARYDSSTRKMVIDGYQYLGKTDVGGTEYEVRMMACLSYAGSLYMSDYDDVIYKGTVMDAGNGQERLSLSPEFFTRDGKTYEVQTMAYGFVKDGNIAGGPDEYDMVEFRISRNKN